MKNETKPDEYYKKCEYCGREIGDDCYGYSERGNLVHAGCETKRMISDRKIYGRTRFEW